jgi:hypothetical protein
LEPQQKIDAKKIYLALGLFVSAGAYGVYQLVRGQDLTPATTVLYAMLGAGGLTGAFIILIFAFKFKRGGK